MIRSRTILFIVYGLAGISLIPILQYHFSLGLYDPNQHGKSEYFYHIIFLCGPTLLFMGWILLRNFRSLMQKALGVIFVMVSFYWLVILLRDISAEQGAL